MKYVCIGRNYLEHIEELKNQIPTEPVVFFKPASSLAQSNCIPYPDFTKELHYELEIVLKIDKKLNLGQKINSITEICSEWSVGLDFTARDAQNHLKSKGLPWELSKSFDNSCFIGKWIPLAKTDMYQTHFSLTLNGTTVQEAKLNQMIHNFETMVNFFSDYFSLEPGDVLFTGTPSGVGPLHKGDQLSGFINDEELLSCVIATD